MATEISWQGIGRNDTRIEPGSIRSAIGGDATRKLLDKQKKG